MLVSITATAVAPEEIRITATNLEAILLEDDLFKKIDANEEKEVTFTFNPSDIRNTFISYANLRDQRRIRIALAKWLMRLMDVSSQLQMVS